MSKLTQRVVLLALVTFASACGSNTGGTGAGGASSVGDTGGANSTGGTTAGGNSSSGGMTSTGGVTSTSGGTAACGTESNPIRVGASESFSPGDCPVVVGQTVNWQWAGSDHTVTTDPGAAVSFDSGGKASGTFQFTLPTSLGSGSVIRYHCDYHAEANSTGCSGMCATLTVQ